MQIENYDFKATMAMIHVTEQYIKILFDEKKIGGTVHLSIGQEAIDTAIIAAHNDETRIFGNHRSHGQWLAATGDIKGLLEQIKNGMSQHLYKPGRFLSTGIQGALLPVAFGSAMATGRRTLCFIGDGTLGEGIFYETLGLCQQYPKVPLTIVVIDNGYSMSKTDTVPRLWYLAHAYEKIQVMDMTDKWESVENMSRALSGFYGGRMHECGPIIIDAKVYRLCGHSCNDTEQYRPAKELTKEWRQMRDPILINRVPPAYIASMGMKVKKIIEQVFTEGG